jgi:hypothetical protein
MAIPGHIYIIREREFIRLNEDIYKVGRTKNLKQRFRDYPKGSEVIFCYQVDDTIEIEKIVLSELRNCFKNRRDIGSEYFEGNKIKISELILKTISENTPIVDKVNCYICEQCGYSTDHKNDMKNEHATCPISDGSCSDIDRELGPEKYGQKLKDNNIKIIYVCKHCNEEEFSTMKDKYRHEIICTKVLTALNSSTNKSVDKNKIISYSSMSNEPSEMDRFIIDIPDVDLKQYLTSKIVGIRKFISNRHFNPNAPERQNIKMKWSEFKQVEVFIGGSWIIMPKEKILEDLILFSILCIIYRCKNNNNLGITDKEKYECINYFNTLDHKDISLVENVSGCICAQTICLEYGKIHSKK